MKLLKLFFNSSGLVMIAAMLAGTSTFAAPVDGSGGSCTFVDAVVTGASVAGPAGAAAAMNRCDVMQYSTAVDDIGVTSGIRATTRNILKMATIFEEEYVAESDLEAIFEFDTTAGDRK